MQLRQPKMWLKQPKCFLLCTKRKSHNHSLSATRVTTQWLKQPIIFCSDDLAEEDNPRLWHCRAHHSQCHWRLRRCTARESVGCCGIAGVGIGIVRDGATSWNSRAALAWHWQWCVLDRCWCPSELVGGGWQQWLSLLSPNWPSALSLLASWHLVLVIGWLKGRWLVVVVVRLWHRLVAIEAGFFVLTVPIGLLSGNSSDQSGWGRVLRLWCSCWAIASFEPLHERLALVR